MNISLNLKKRKGTVLIFVLWMVALVSVLVASLAANIRLSAKTAFHQREQVQFWADTQAALSMAKMDIIQYATLPKTELILDNPIGEYRFRGKIQPQYYELPETVSVSIYDHVGKINLKRLPPSKMYALLKKQIGEDDERLTALINTWTDWIDKNDLKSINGAEAEYYETLIPSYKPRNGFLESVEELLLIKGYAEIFNNVNMHAAFTVYGTHTGIDFNYATLDTLRLIPRLDEATIALILERRKTEVIDPGSLGLLLDSTIADEVLSWHSPSKGGYYSIAVSKKMPEGEKALPYAWIEDVRIDVSLVNKNPVLMMRVNPYGKLPQQVLESITH